MKLPLLSGPPALGVPVKFQKLTVSLEREEIPDFVDWLFLDLATRIGRAGRRQKEPLRGVFCSILTRGRGGMRASDFTPRLALAVHAWHCTGLPVLQAVERVTYDQSDSTVREFVKARLGKSRRGRHTAWGEGKTEIDETVRTYYYKFRQKHPNMDGLLGMQFFMFKRSCDWAIAASERAMEIAAARHPNPARLRSFVNRIRHKSSS